MLEAVGVCLPANNAYLVGGWICISVFVVGAMVISVALMSDKLGAGGLRGLPCSEERVTGGWVDMH